MLGTALEKAAMDLNKQAPTESILIIGLHLVRPALVEILSYLERFHEQVVNMQRRKSQKIALQGINNMIKIAYRYRQMRRYIP